MASENGWEPLHPTVEQLEWVTVPGTNVHLQFLKGQPLAILRAFAADFNAYVEPLRDADSAAYTPTNSVATSNHLNGTAMDLNWNSHQFRVLNAGFNGSQIATIRELLAWYEKTVWWGNDWNTPKDAMHWNMGYDTYGSANVGRVQDVITRKIRPDGFSTFRRGGTATPPLVVDAVSVLARATLIPVSRAASILGAVIDGLRESRCTNPNRIAMWLAQIGHEAGSFVYTEEIQSGDENTDRWKYKGRTWIQITWSSNYGGFSQWCFDRQLVPTRTYFVDHPKELAELKWAGLGAAWYWTVARPNINTMCDAKDLIGVTKAINGGTNGLEDRQRRYNLALTLGDQLLALTTTISAPPPTEEGFLMALSDQEQRNLYNALMNQRNSRSPLRHLGEGTVGDVPDQIWDMDGTLHVLIVELLARLGDPDTLGLLREVAGADLGKFPDRGHDKQLAQALLNKLTATRAAVATVVNVTAAPVPVPVADLPALLPAPVAPPKVSALDQPLPTPAELNDYVPRHAQPDGVSETIAALRLAAQFKKAPEIAGPATDLLDALEGYQP